MPWDVATARTYLGEPSDPPTDDAIQTVLDYTLDSIEERLGRYLLRGLEVQKWYEVGANGIVLARRYPIETLESMDGDVVPSDVDVEIRPLQGIFDSDQFAGRRVLELSYMGGYDDTSTGGAGSVPWPPALERAMWECFITAWNSSDQSTGLPPSSGGGGVIVGSGDVKSLTVFDAFKVDYDVGTTSVGDSTGANDQALWGWLAPWASVLAFYRAGQAGVELGMA